MGYMPTFQNDERLMIFKPTQLFDGVKFHDDKSIRVVNDKVAERVTYYHEPCIELDGVIALVPK